MGVLNLGWVNTKFGWKYNKPENKLPKLTTLYFGPEEGSFKEREREWEEERSKKQSRENNKERKNARKEEEKVKEEALQLIETFQPLLLPRLIVFDLDYTLWPYYCESRAATRELPVLYPDARGIILALKEKGIDLAIASRSNKPDIAKAFLERLEIQSLFVVQEIFTCGADKAEHFQRIHRTTGLPFNSMLFFDDLDSNIKSALKMGVTSVLVGKDGVNLEALRQGLTNFAQSSGGGNRK